MSAVERIVYDPNHLNPFPYGRNTQQDGSIEAEISNGDNQNSCESPSAEKNEVTDSDFKAVRVLFYRVTFFLESTIVSSSKLLLNFGISVVSWVVIIPGFKEGVVIR